MDRRITGPRNVDLRDYGRLRHIAFEDVNAETFYMMEEINNALLPLVKRRLYIRQLPEIVKSFVASIRDQDGQSQPGIVQIGLQKVVDAKEEELKSKDAVINRQADKIESLKNDIEHVRKERDYFKSAAGWYNVPNSERKTRIQRIAEKYKELQREHASLKISFQTMVDRIAGNKPVPRAYLEYSKNLEKRQAREQAVRYESRPLAQLQEHHVPNPTPPSSSTSPNESPRKRKRSPPLEADIILISDDESIPDAAQDEDIQETIPTVQDEDIQETIPTVQDEDVQETISIAEINEDIQETIPTVQDEDIQTISIAQVNEYSQATATNAAPASPRVCSWNKNYSWLPGGRLLPQHMMPITKDNSHSPRKSDDEAEDQNEENKKSRKRRKLNDSNVSSRDTIPSPESSHLSTEQSTREETLSSSRSSTVETCIGVEMMNIPGPDTEDVDPFELEMEEALLMADNALNDIGQGIEINDEAVSISPDLTDGEELANVKASNISADQTQPDHLDLVQPLSLVPTSDTEEPMVKADDVDLRSQTQVSEALDQDEEKQSQTSRSSTPDSVIPPVQDLRQSMSTPSYIWETITPHTDVPAEGPSWQSYASNGINTKSPDSFTYPVPWVADESWLRCPLCALPDCPSFESTDPTKDIPCLNFKRVWLEREKATEMDFDRNETPEQYYNKWISERQSLVWKDEMDYLNWGKRLTEEEFERRASLLQKEKEEEERKKRGNDIDIFCKIDLRIKQLDPKRYPDGKVIGSRDAAFQTLSALEKENVKYFEQVQELLGRQDWSREKKYDFVRRLLVRYDMVTKSLHRLEENKK